MIKAVIFDMFETLITHYRTPIYFSDEMAKDTNIPIENFQKIWRETDSDRTLGIRTFESVLEEILRANDKYTEDLFKTIIERRIKAKKACLESIDSEVINMLDTLKEKGIKLGLITNCFSEEATIINNSNLIKYFDSVCMSSVEKIKKPDPKIYSLSLERLNVKSNEALFIGDGGSNELNGAKNMGITPLKACWYLIESGMFDENKDKDFIKLIEPSNLIKYIEDCNRKELHI